MNEATKWKAASSKKQFQEKYSGANDMFRKLTALLLILALVLLACPALADSAPQDQYFKRAKDALYALAQGDTAQALEKLAFSYALPDDSDDKFLQFVKDYLPLLSADTVQTQVAVCYYESVSAQWLMAIPISEPASDDVMALVLMSSDLSTFSGYAALSWAEVNDGVALSDSVFWNTEYSAGSAVLYAD